MREQIAGIHHLTAIASDPQRNVDFYTNLLGLRLVKLTVNFDDPSTYHLYYGDERGQPGTILTFFPWPGARRGRRGTGQVAVTSFSVPEGSLDYWEARLRQHDITVGQRQRRFGEESLAFLDPDWMHLELVAHPEADQLPPWEGGPVPEASAVRGFHGVTLWARDPEPTQALILIDTVMSIMDGGEAARRLNSDPEFAGVPVILFSGARLARETGGRLPVAGQPFPRNHVPVNSLPTLLG